MVNRISVTQAAGFLSRAGSSFADRVLGRPIGSVDALGVFVGQRAAVVAQTTLYGYLKTRMGTKFPTYFADPVFSREIKQGAVRQFLSCASDLAIHAAARVAADGRLEQAEAAGLARRCFADALGQGLADVEPAMIAGDPAAAFAERAGRTVWASAADGEAAFRGSIDELIRNAPVIDSFRRDDTPIVRNSIRLRWINLREELQRRLDVAAVAADFRRSSTG